MKQKTTHVDSYPGDSSDPEAVSGSSTTILNFSSRRKVQQKKQVLKIVEKCDFRLFFDYKIMVLEIYGCVIKTSQKQFLTHFMLQIKEEDR